MIELRNPTPRAVAYKRRCRSPAGKFNESGKENLKLRGSIRHTEVIASRHVPQHFRLSNRVGGGIFPFPRRRSESPSNRGSSAPVQLYLSYADERPEAIKVYSMLPR